VNKVKTVNIILKSTLNIYIGKRLTGNKVSKMVVGRQEGKG
jgi:hypothetical protein